MSNSENPINGAIFQGQVLSWFEDHFHTNFELEKKIPIGEPAKDHKFDIVSVDNRIAIECKRYTWTVAGNVPSAKMGFTNEAAFYLSFLPDSFDKYIVMLYSFHEKRNETLAEYYYRTYKHLLGNIKIAEYNPSNGQMHIIGDTCSQIPGQIKYAKDATKQHNFSQKNVKNAIILLKERKSDISRYCELLKQAASVNVAKDKDFQKAYTAFYRVRRDDVWRTNYFNLFEELKSREHETSFEEIQMRLFQQCGQVESSFASKMLATLDPEMPIWDKYVLNNLELKLKGKTKEERLSRAVVLYEDICCWYREFLETTEARSMIEMFDQIFPEFSHITEIKKIDFIIWASR